MRRKCQPGIICLQNGTMIGLAIVFAVIVYYATVYLQQQQQQQQQQQSNAIEEDKIVQPIYVTPINVQTNVGAVNTSFEQVGILTLQYKRQDREKEGKRERERKREGKRERESRPLFVNRDKWQYYSMSDQFNAVRLPLRVRGRSCMNEYGCDRLCDGDIVYVDAYDAPYRCSLYNTTNNSMRMRYI